MFGRREGGSGGRREGGSGGRREEREKKSRGEATRSRTPSLRAGRRRFYPLDRAGASRSKHFLVSIHDRRLDAPRRHQQQFFRDHRSVCHCEGKKARDGGGEKRCEMMRTKNDAGAKERVRRLFDLFYLLSLLSLPLSPPLFLALFLSFSLSLPLSLS